VFLSGYCLEFADRVAMLEVVAHLAESEVSHTRRSASRMMSRWSMTASRSKLRSLA